VYMSKAAGLAGIPNSDFFIIDHLVRI